MVTRKGAVTEEGKLRDSGQITYLTEMVKGREAMALFTSERRIVERYGPGTPIILMPGIEALKLAKGLPVAINPGLSPSAFIKASLVASVINQFERKQHPSGEV